MGLIFICGLAVSTAHESRPLFVEITEKEAGVFELQYKIPPTIPEFNLPE